MAKTTLYRVTVQFGDCDPAGIVFYPNFQRWIDAASLSFFMQCGVPTMPRVFTSSRHGGTPHCMKNDSDAASIQRWKFG